MMSDTPEKLSVVPRSIPSKPGRLERFAQHLRREWQLYVMLLPTVIWLLVFLYKPMYGLQIAFKDYSIFKGVAGSPWVGFEHFESLFAGDVAGERDHRG